MAPSIPEGYEILPGPPDSGITLVVVAREREALLRAGIERPEAVASGPTVSDWVGGGRVRHPVISVGQDRCVLKAYRRGGLVARWNLDRYWGPGRFLRELETSVRAVHAGVPAPQPIALVLKAAGWGGSFRAWQVVRYMPGVRSLREVLRDPTGDRGPAPKVGPLFRAAGGAVRRMHQAEIDHPDLNIGNILTRPGEDGRAEAFIVDWDRARIRPAGSWNPHRNLLRLWRSVLKLSHRSPAGAADRAALLAFLRGYFEKDIAGLRALRGYARPRMAFLALHSLLWDLARIGRTG
jgi:3-deoxy-D-manno-octulosonic acid kinase